jgi:hypothetical protein
MTGPGKKKRRKPQTKATVGPVACTLEVTVRETTTSPANPMDRNKVTLKLVAQAAPNQVISVKEIIQDGQGGLIYRYSPVAESWYAATGVRMEGSRVATKGEKKQIDVRARPAKEGGTLTKAELVLYGVPTIDLLDRDGNVINPASKSVRIGLFDGAYIRDFRPGLGPVDPHGNFGKPDQDIRSPILNEMNELTETRNFVGSDTRRFIIRVRHESAEGVQTLPDGRRYVTARWFTRHPNGAVLDDNRGSAEITLVEQGPGDYRSMGLMMVTWPEDRDLATHCGIRNRYPAGNEKRAYGETDHRLRQAGMFCETVVMYPISPSPNVEQRHLVARAFVPADRRTLRLNVFVGRRSGTTPTPVATPADVFNLGLQRMKYIYESIGVCVQTAPHTTAEEYLAKGHAGITKETQPGGTDFYYVIDTQELLENRDLDHLTADGRWFFAKAFPDLNNAVRILLVGGFSPPMNGYGYCPASFAGEPISGCCFCMPDTVGIPADPPSTRMIMAHEVGHVVTDKTTHYGIVADQTLLPWLRPDDDGGHFSRPATPSDNRFVNYYNLMGGCGCRLWDVSVRETWYPIPNDPATSGPVLNFNQYLDIRDHSAYVHPSG